MLAELLLRFGLKHSFCFSLISANTDREISVCPALLRALVGFLRFVGLLPGMLFAQTLECFRCFFELSFLTHSCIINSNKGNL